LGIKWGGERGSVEFSELLAGVEEVEGLGLVESVVALSEEAEPLVNDFGV
jgi:hypothetical protein